MGDAAGARRRTLGGAAAFLGDRADQGEDLGDQDAFVVDDRPQTTIDLTAHPGEASLAELDIGEHDADAA